MGNSSQLLAGFEYRPIAGEDANSRTAAWLPAGTAVTITRPGVFSTRVHGLSLAKAYEFRAVVHHPLLAIYGTELTMKR